MTMSMMDFEGNIITSFDLVLSLRLPSGRFAELNVGSRDNHSLLYRPYSETMLTPEDRDFLVTEIDRVIKAAREHPDYDSVPPPCEFVKLEA